MSARVARLADTPGAWPAARSPLPELLTFEILWYAGGPEYAPNRCVGRDTVRRRDLSAAIVAACNLLKRGKGNHSGLAQGFYVRRAREED